MREGIINGNNKCQLARRNRNREDFSRVAIGIEY